MLQIKNIFIITFAFFLLVSAMGVSLEKMTCLSSGKSKIALFEAKECCPEDEKVPAGFQSRCCDFVKEFVQVDYLSVEKPTELSSLQTAVLLSFTKIFTTLFKADNLSILSDKPPLPSGFNLLILISIFRI
jgi:hypothetical protein